MDNKFNIIAKNLLNMMIINETYHNEAKIVGFVLEALPKMGQQIKEPNLKIEEGDAFKLKLSLEKAIQFLRQNVTRQPEKAVIKNANKISSNDVINICLLAKQYLDNITFSKQQHALSTITNATFDMTYEVYNEPEKVYSMMDDAVAYCVEMKDIKSMQVILQKLNIITDNVLFFNSFDHIFGKLKNEQALNHEIGAIVSEIEKYINSQSEGKQKYLKFKITRFELSINKNGGTKKRTK